MLLDLGQEPPGDYDKESELRKLVRKARAWSLPDFGVGDLVMLERPAILEPQIMPGFHRAAEIEKLINQLIARLPEDVRKGYLALSNYQPGPEVLFGIARTDCLFR
jgi:hypothetical protein